MATNNLQFLNRIQYAPRACKRINRYSPWAVPAPHFCEPCQTPHNTLDYRKQWSHPHSLRSRTYKQQQNYFGWGVLKCLVPK